MKDNKSRSLSEFCKDAANRRGTDINKLLPLCINKDIGHFNVFDLAETVKGWKQILVMLYNRKADYKISLIRAKNTTEYTDKLINIEANTLLFGTPQMPYRGYLKIQDYQEFIVCSPFPTFSKKHSSITPMGFCSLNRLAESRNRCLIFANIKPKQNPN